MNCTEAQSTLYHLKVNNISTLRISNAIISVSICDEQHLWAIN